MSFAELTYTLKNILKANTRIQEVYDYDTIKFRGYPAVVIIPSDNESDYETTTENQRKYVFTIRVFVERKVNKPEEAESILRNLMDTMLDDLEKSANWTLTSANLPAGYTLLVLHPSPSAWGYQDVDNATLRYAEIKVVVLVSVDCNIIT